MREPVRNRLPLARLCSCARLEWAQASAERDATAQSRDPRFWFVCLIVYWACWDFQNLIQ